MQSNYVHPRVEMMMTQYWILLSKKVASELDLLKNVLTLRGMEYTTMDVVYQLHNGHVQELQWMTAMVTGGDNGDDDDDFLPFDEDVNDPDDFNAYPPHRGSQNKQQARAYVPFCDDCPCQLSAGDLSSENN
jgi:hypothetical protein